MIYNPKTIDYSKGVIITDLVTGKTYSHEEAMQLDPRLSTD